MAKKKLTSDEALSKIKIMINDFYANIGAGSKWGLSVDFEVLVSEINEIISNSKINSKILLIEQLKFDDLKEKRDDTIYFNTWLGKKIDKMNRDLKNDK